MNHTPAIVKRIFGPSEDCTCHPTRKFGAKTERKPWRKCRVILSVFVQLVALVPLCPFAAVPINSVLFFGGGWYWMKVHFRWNKKCWIARLLGRLSRFPWLYDLFIEDEIELKRNVNNYSLVILFDFPEFCTRKTLKFGTAYVWSELLFKKCNNFQDIEQITSKEQISRITILSNVF